MQVRTPVGRRKKGEKPRFITCYICGREYGALSINHHIPMCKSKWKKQQLLKPKHERRPLPKPPQVIAAGGVLDLNDKKTMAELNAAMQDTFEKEGQVTCPWCGRTFNEKAFKSHQKSCTQERPAKRLVRSSATNRPKLGLAARSPAKASVLTPRARKTPTKKPVKKSLNSTTPIKSRASPSLAEAKRAGMQKKKRAAPVAEEDHGECDSCGALQQQDGWVFCFKCGSKKPEPPPPLCDFCEYDNAAITCSDCSMSLCNVCTKLAHKAAHKQQHNIMTL